jgi:hypothetical protein
MFRCFRREEAGSCRYSLAAEDDVVRVIILQANGKHLSADHS